MKVIGPMLVFLFIKYSIWSSIYADDPQQLIGGYTLQEMLVYHLWFLVVALMGMAYFGVDLADDIRLGKISSYLIYPFNLWEFHAAKFVALQVIQLGIACLTIGVVYLVLGDFMNPWNTANVIWGLLLSLQVACLWFGIQYITGLLAFWLETTWTLRVILQYLMQFLSGAIIPLELYPDWLVRILNYTPFPYLGFVPVKTYMGAYEEVGFAMIILAFWTGVMVLLATWIWRRGLRLYTAAGM